MQLPTMLIVGAQKCGTSTLAEALNLHPQIFMTRKPKEVHFFDRHFDRGVDWYAQQFRPAPGQTQAGEASPSYMFEEEGRRRMAQTLPDASLIIILRDPSKRAYSHYWHRRRIQESTVKPTFESAIEDELRDTEQNQPRHRRHAYLARGRYIDQILAVVEGHGRENVHVMLLEDLSTDWAATLRELFTFLDVDAGQAEQIPSLWKHQYTVTTSGGKSRRAEYPPMAPQTRADLVEIYREDNDRLASWLGRDLSAWNSV